MKHCKTVMQFCEKYPELTQEVALILENILAVETSLATLTAKITLIKASLVAASNIVPIPANEVIAIAVFEQFAFEVFRVVEGIIQLDDDAIRDGCFLVQIHSYYEEVKSGEVSGHILAETYNAEFNETLSAQFERLRFNLLSHFVASNLAEVTTKLEKAREQGRTALAVGLGARQLELTNTLKFAEELLEIKAPDQLGIVYESAEG